MLIDCSKLPWLGGKDAALYVSRSRDWLEIRALQCPKDSKEEEPVRGRVRCKNGVTSGDRRYFVPDLDALQE
ncbi:MAG TPA: hypothetical protein VEC99_12970 [Clostridia bacterium]|nr:hypothetical protein [Clostridia bacterium]